MSILDSPIKISVITVCYNSASTLVNALNSVAEQDWPFVEHIVIDGGSTDGTVEIINRYGSKIAKFVSEPDSGIYDAMNKGLDRATGDIICFLNADDCYTSCNVFSRVATQMQLHALDALMGDVYFFDNAKPDHIVRRYRSDRFSPERLAWGWMPAHPALFLSKTLVQRVGHFRTDYRIAGDFEYIVRVFKNNDIHYEHLPEVLVRMQIGGISTNGWRSRILLNREVLRACRENGLETNFFKILSKYPAKILELLQK
jgi:glycosyltransferase involved in cell wall biosynthesis